MTRKKLIEEIIYFSKVFNFIEWTVDENSIFINVENSLNDVSEVENYLYIFSKHLKWFTLDKKRFINFINELQKVRDSLE